jgi:hypothetical protein
MATDGKGGSLSDRGQHSDLGGSPPNSGQRNTPRDPDLGKKAVPASDPSADISTERKS